jgi:hypothetical protein
MLRSMEVLAVLIAVAVLVALVCGLFMIAAPFIGWGIAVLTAFWPLILGCAIGVPLSLSASGKVAGNVIVIAGVVGNVIWLMRKKK